MNRASSISFNAISFQLLKHACDDENLLFVFDLLVGEMAGDMLHTLFSNLGAVMLSQYQ